RIAGALVTAERRVTMNERRRTSVTGHLWAIGYDDTSRAGDVKNEIVRLGWDQTYLALSDVAVVVRHPDGALHVEPRVVSGGQQSAGVDPCGSRRGLGGRGAADGRRARCRARRRRQRRGEGVDGRHRRRLRAPGRGDDEAWDVGPVRVGPRGRPGG